MRIIRITIQGLFDYFNHTINLKNTERITIIHGPNGYGKTTIFKLLNGLFNGEYSLLFNIPFKKFIIDFEDSSYLKIEKYLQIQKDITGRDLHLRRLIISRYISETNESKKVVISSDNEDIEPDIRRILKRTFLVEDEEFEYLKPNQWLDKSVGEIIDTTTLFNRYRNLFPKSIVNKIIRKQRRLDDIVKDMVSIYFIESQRLIIQELDKMRYKYRRKYTEKILSAVVKYSKELSTEIKACLTEYATKSQSLDRTFPARLLNFPMEGDKYELLSVKQIREELEEMDKIRKRLISVGLLNKEEEVAQPIKEIADYNRHVLTLYLKDVKEKLHVFDSLANKLEIINDIIKRRFKFKKMIINKDRGFIFEVLNPSLLTNKFIEPTNLSSGEQHQLVVFFELLFKAKENSLILIDEPEISLHIGWQKMFLVDLLKVAKINKLDIIIATHSPQIINDRWDLTVELEAPNT